MTVTLTYRQAEFGIYDSLDAAFVAATKRLAPHCLHDVIAETAAQAKGRTESWGLTLLVEHVAFEIDRVVVQADGTVVLQQRCVIKPAKGLSRNVVVKAFNEVYGQNVEEPPVAP